MEIDKIIQLIDCMLENNELRITDYHVMEYTDRVLKNRKLYPTTDFRKMFHGVRVHKYNKKLTEEIYAAIVIKQKRNFIGTMKYYVGIDLYITDKNNNIQYSDEISDVNLTLKLYNVIKKHWDRQEEERKQKAEKIRKESLENIGKLADKYCK